MENSIRFYVDEADCREQESRTRRQVTAAIVTDKGLVEAFSNRKKRFNSSTEGDNEMSTTSDIVNQHMNCFYRKDLDGVVADSASDAVLFIPSGPLRGVTEIRPFFQAFVAEFSKPGTTFSMQQQCSDGDYAYILWNAESADNTYEPATDTSIVRNGKILAQSFAAKITPKI